MTVISIVKLIGLHKGQHRIAELLAIDSLIFMTSALLSYSSMRNETAHYKLAEMMEKVADLAFMLGLLTMTVVGFMLAYEIF